MKPLADNECDNYVNTVYDEKCGCVVQVMKFIPYVNSRASTREGVLTEIKVLQFCNKKHLSSLMSDVFYIGVDSFFTKIEIGTYSTEWKLNPTKTLVAKSGKDSEGEDFD